MPSTLNLFLNSQDTYICCAYNPRCFIIQKVKPNLHSSLRTNNCDSGINWKHPTAKDLILPNCNIEPTSVSTSILKGKKCPNETKFINKVALGTKTTEALRNKFGGESYNEHILKLTCRKSVNSNQSMNISSRISKENMNVNDKSNEMPVINKKEDNLVELDQPLSDNSDIDSLSKQNNNLNQGENQDGELRKLLQRQLEFYFSRENLARDTYLLSQMDSDQYVPITTVANFEQVKKLTNNMDLIIEVLKESACVQVDQTGQKVRPNHKRSVLILREIPETTPLLEIENLFNGKNCPKFVSCEFAHNNSWYVTFETDEDAQKAYCYIREEIKVFPTTGKPIMARIKAKPIVHSTASSCKNGFRPSASNSTIQSERCTLHSQPFDSQPNFTYANVPPVNFQNSRIYPPFYPPQMLQAWTPTASACYDLSAVFVANGLAPHTFGRHSYHTMKSSGRGKGHVCKKNVVFNNINNGTSPIINGSTVPENNTAPVCINSKVNSHTKNPAISLNTNSAIKGATIHLQTSHDTSTKSTDFSNNKSNSTNTNYQQTKQSLNELSINNSYLNVQKNNGKNRKLKRREDANGNVGNNKTDSNTINATLHATTLNAAPSFDLEAAAFPPLPCSNNASSNNGSSNNGSGEMKELKESSTFQCSSLADVVKGTIKLKDIGKAQNDDNSSTTNFSSTENALDDLDNLSDHLTEKFRIDNCINDINEGCKLSKSDKTITSQEIDHATIPAKIVYSLKNSDEIEETESAFGNHMKRIDCAAVNGNDSLTNSNSINENDHSNSNELTSANQLQSDELQSVNENNKECNGHHSNEESISSSIDDVLNKTENDFPDLISSIENNCKKLTYSQIAQRSKDENHKQNDCKEPHDISSNSSTCSSKASSKPYSSKSGRSKFGTRGLVFGKKEVGFSLNEKCKKRQLISRNEDVRETYVRNFQRN